MGTGPAKPLPSVREGFQTVIYPLLQREPKQKLVTFAQGMVGVEFNRRNGDTFGLHVRLFVANCTLPASCMSQGKTGAGFSVEEMFQVTSSLLRESAPVNCNILRRSTVLNLESTQSSM